MALKKHDFMVFQTVVQLKSARDSFPNDVPTARAVCLKLESCLKENKKFDIIDGDANDPSPRIFSIVEISVEGDHAAILFHATDPTVRDPSYKELNSGEIVESQRPQDAEPAYSAHAVINIASNFDDNRLYPLAIQDTDVMSRTRVLELINHFLKTEYYDKEKETTEKGQTKVYQIMAMVIAPFSASIARKLANGADLLGIDTILEEPASPTAFGSGGIAHTTVRRSTTFRKTASKEEKIEGIKKYWSNIRKGEYKSIKVRLNDPDNVTSKVVDIKKMKQTFSRVL